MEITDNVSRLIGDMEYICRLHIGDDYKEEKGKKEIEIIKSGEDSQGKLSRMNWALLPGSNWEGSTYSYWGSPIYIGHALITILELIEERYGISFDELERKRKEQ